MSNLGINWYDFVVFLALLYGIWSGIRTGLSGEIIRVLGLLLMIWLAVVGYAPVGAWIEQQTGWVIEVAHLVAFIGIAVVVYAGTTVIRLFVHKQMEKLHFAAVVENLGGGAAGFVRMAAIMTVLTVVLTLVRSPFWHKQVAQDSKFGTFVVQHFPAVAAAAEKQFPEKMWFLRDMKRPKEPGVDEADSGTTNKPR